MVCFFVFKKTNTQREPAIPADVSISKSALYSRIGASDAESTTALLYPQQDLDSALRLARAEVTVSTTWERKNCPLLLPSCLFSPKCDHLFCSWNHAQPHQSRRCHTASFTCFTDVKSRYEMKINLYGFKPQVYPVHLDIAI